ncbi:MAG: DNA-processing protein DprA [bacterium]|nr:DNA-processing protein DprA [bacterium]
MSQHIYYNAVNRFYQGNYGAVEATWNRFHNWQAAWEHIRKDSRLDPDKEWGALAKRNVRLVLRDDDDYPPLLRETGRTPFGLYLLGDPDWSRPAVAIVGTRKATGEGLRIAHTFAQDLAAQGIVITSGLALGIDGAAHAGAISSGARGATIAVLPCGLDDVYPKTHANLASSIVKNASALVSEYPFGTPAFPLNFLERNRIVAGISRGTLVIEAPLKSGALVTARLAVEANRDVFAVPGPISHPNYVGPHKLIQEGAGLVTCAEDVCAGLNLLYQKSGPAVETDAAALSPAEQTVLAILKKAGKPLGIDSIVELSKLEAQTVNSAVALLSVNGTLVETNGLYSL